VNYNKYGEEEDSLCEQGTDIVNSQVPVISVYKTYTGAFYIYKNM